MPPPKRPKSDVHWTTLYAEAGSTDVPERNCSSDVAVGCHSASINEHHVDDLVATSISGPSTSLSTVDGRRGCTDAAATGADEAPSGSRQLTSLRRLLLEPVPPAAASDLSTTLSTSSVLVTAAAHVLQVPASSLNNVAVRSSQSVAATAGTAAAARDRLTDVGPCRSLPPLSLIHI